jgi:D-alanyl-D-alanine carboxypeptidase
MSLKWQALILIGIILVSLTVTRLYSIGISNNYELENSSSTEDLYNEKSSPDEVKPVKKMPIRKWDVLDPSITAKSAIVHSLDDNLPFFYKNSREPRILASLTKLFTSIIVLEDIGLDKKIPITEKIISTQGLAGNLKSGESYSARDLLKIMLLTSSNDAAAAFEEFVGGKEIMAQKINSKAIELGLDSISVEDASGLCDYNMGKPIDFLELSKYILKNNPEIFIWTQSHDIWVQPWNGSEERKVYNINAIANRKDFLGGKTGTSEIAGENLVALFNIKDKRVIIILMNSENREKDVETLINWVKKAYDFPEDN